jgi:hypothetical protein
MADSASESAAELAKKARELSSSMSGYSSAAGSASAAAGLLASGLQQLSGGAVNFTKQLASGNDSFSKFNGSINQLADGTGDLLMAMGPNSLIMAGFGLLAKALGAVVGKVFENEDKLMGSYDKLAEFGVATSLTTDALMKAGDTAGYPNDNGLLKILTDNVSKISTDLLGLAGTSSKGFEAFTKISEVTNDTLNKFNKLGISQKKLNEYQASYVSLQVKTGAASKMTTDQLQAGSIRYAENLVELAAVTGKTTDQIKESQKNDLNDVAYAIHARQVAAKENGAQQLERERDALERLEQVGGPEMRKGFLKVLASGNASAPEAQGLANALALGNVNLDDLMKGIKSGQITAEQAAKKVQDAQALALKKLGNNATLLDANALKMLNVTPDSVKGLSQVIEEGTDKKVKEDIKNAKDRKDEIKDQQNINRNTSKDIALAMDEFVRLISGAVHTVFKGLIYALTALSKGLISFLSLPMVEKLTGMKIDKSITAMFLSTEELTSRNAEITKQLEDVKKSETKGEATAYMSNNPSRTAGNKEMITKSLLEEQKAIQEALELRKQTEKASTPSTAAGKTPAAPAAQTSTAPAPPGPQASGAAPPPTATPGSHADGGVARPPFSGFSGALGGTEATIPLPSGENIPAKIKMPSDLTTNRDSLLGSSDTVQGLMTQYTSNLGGGTTAPSTSGAPAKSGGNVFELISSRMDDLIEKMTKNNALQTELLQLSKR